MIGRVQHGMEIAVTVPGEDEYRVRMNEGTYGDLLREIGYSPQEASILVDGNPVPADQPITAERVTVLRLVAGGR